MEQVRQFRLENTLSLIILFSFHRWNNNNVCYRAKPSYNYREDYF